MANLGRGSDPSPEVGGQVAPDGRPPGPLPYEGVWRFSGGSDMAPPADDTGKTAKEAAVRSTLRIAPDRSEMAALWERTDDGRNWLPWMDMHFTREDAD